MHDNNKTCDKKICCNVQNCVYHSGETTCTAKTVDVVSGALRIVIPVLLVIAAMNVVSSRVEGFAFIYFSNQEVLQEVQTPANMASAHGAIANIVLLGVAAVVGIVAAFFSVEKKEA